MPSVPTSGLRRTLLAGLITAWLGPATAHDFWIEAGSFRPAVGASVPLVLRVGENFTGTSQPFVPDWFVDFSVSSAQDREPLAGLAGDDPAATLRFGTPGLRLAGYHSHRSFVALDAAKFDGYLAAEGLEGIRELRRARGESGSDGREYYSRCAKALLAVGGSGDAGFDLELGYPLELIPRANPYRLAPGATLPLALHFRGRPVAGVLVVAFTAERPAARFAARTDRDGRVSLPVNRAGTWLVKAVHMIEVPDTDPAADWESFWASLTFAVPERAGAPAPP